MILFKLQAGIYLGTVWLATVPGSTKPSGRTTSIGNTWAQLERQLAAQFFTLPYLGRKNDFRRKPQ